MTTVSDLFVRLCAGDLVNDSDVALVCHTSVHDVAEWRTETAASNAHTERRLHELSEVVELIRRVMRDEAGRRWLHSANAELAGERPLDLIARGDHRRVCGLLLALAEGVTS